MELDSLPFKVNMDKTAAELRLLKAERRAMEKELHRNKELYERMVLPTVSNLRSGSQASYFLQWLNRQIYYLQVDHFHSLRVILLE